MSSYYSNIFKRKNKSTGKNYRHDSEEFTIPFSITYKGFYHYYLNKEKDIYFSQEQKLNFK